MRNVRISRSSALFCAAVAGLLGACVDTSAGSGFCETDADCRAGTTCRKDEASGQSLCVRVEEAVCTTACGEGFHCAVGDDRAPKCIVDTGREGTVRVVAPELNTLTKGGAMPVVCEAQGPQVRRVSATATLAGSAPVDLQAPAPTGEANRWATTFAAGSAADGEHVIVCILEYGPDGFTVQAQSAPVPVRVDRTSPVIAHTAPTGWHKHSATVTLQATASDEGSEVAPATAKLQMDGVGEVAGTATDGGNFSFEVDLSKALPANAEGPIGYRISVEDRAGNKAESDFSLQVDGTGPTGSIAAADQTAWRALTGGRFTAKATIASTGAPVAAVKLKNGAGTTEIEATKGSANEWSFEIDPPLFSATGQEGEAAWTLLASDEAGNESQTAGSFRIDGKGPELAVVLDEAWHALGETVSVTVNVTDGGKGLDPATVKVRGTSSACTAGANNAFTCRVSTTPAPSGAETPAFAFTIDATDQAGNGGFGSGSLKVDGKEPTVTLTPDGKWYPRTGIIAVRAAVEDTGSGFATASPPTIKVGMKTYTGTIEAGVAVVNVIPLEFTFAATTNPAVAFTLQVKDALGHQTEKTGSLKIDGQPPAITGVGLTYPASPIAANTLLRRDPIQGTRHKATVSATISDPNSGSGLVPATVVLTYTGIDGKRRKISPASVAGDVHSWVFDASDAEFKADAGSVTLGIEAADGAGNLYDLANATVAGITRKLWNYPETGEFDKVVGAVAFSGGRVFFARAVRGALDQNVFAINATTGQKDWSTNAAGMPTTPISVGPTKLYFGSDAVIGSNPAGALNAVGFDGTPAWQCAGYGAARGALATGLVSWQTTPTETIFYASDEPAVWAFRRNGANTDCDSKIAQNTSGGDPRMAVPLFTPTKLFFGTLDGNLVRNDLVTTPSLMSNPVTTQTGNDPVSGAALDSSGLPFFQNRGFVAKLSAIHAETYRGTASAYTKLSYSPPSLLSDNSVVFGTDTGHVFSFDTSAPSPRWSFQVLDSKGNAKEVRTTPTIGQRKTTDGTTYQLYFGAGDGKLHALTDAGVEMWSYNAGMAIESSAALDCKGILYFGTNNGHVHALVTDSDAIANTPWPRFQHDNKNSGSLATPIWNGDVCQD